jgi:hypothetical protein
VIVAVAAVLVVVVAPKITPPALVIVAVAI